MLCDTCDKNFDCEEPCASVIGWIDLPDNCRDKTYKPRGHISGWEGQITRRLDVVKEYHETLDFN